MGFTFRPLSSMRERGHARLSLPIFADSIVAVFLG